MSRQQRRWFTRTVLVLGAGILIAAPGLARAGGGAGEDSQMTAAAVKTERGIITAYNDKRWDDLGPLYADDAVMLPPNHEPVRGRAGIVDYLRGVRDTVGPVTEQNTEPVRIRSTANLADIVGKFTIQSGRVRMMAHELYERQADGSVLCGVDEFSFRDAAGG